MRTVNFSKQHTQFCAADNIEPLAALMFARIGNMNYFRQLARQAGYNLDFAKVDSDTMMLATIHAASGIQDTLLRVFDEIISLFTDNSQ